jgi:hypothetical protein
MQSKDAWVFYALSVMRKYGKHATKALKSVHRSRCSKMHPPSKINKAFNVSQICDTTKVCILFHAKHCMLELLVKFCKVAHDAAKPGMPALMEFQR